MQFEPLLPSSEDSQAKGRVHFDADIDNSDEDDADLPDR